MAPSLRTSPDPAFQAADDTLVIDVSTLPILVDMTYDIWFSYLIEGDWDLTNTDTFRAGLQHRFPAACNLAWYGTVNFPDDSNFADIVYKPRLRPHYVINSTSQTGDLDGTEIITALPMPSRGPPLRR